MQTEDAFHFVTYVPVDGTVYELDGLKVCGIDEYAVRSRQDGPIPIGNVEDGDWIATAKKAIDSRIATYGAEIRFNLMAVVENRKQVCTRQIEELEKERQAVVDKNSGGFAFSFPSDTFSTADAMEVEGDDLTAKLMQIDDKIEQLRGFVANEEAKFAQWRVTFAHVDTLNDFRLKIFVANTITSHFCSISSKSSRKKIY